MLCHNTLAVEHVFHHFTLRHLCLFKKVIEKRLEFIQKCPVAKKLIPDTFWKKILSRVFTYIFWNTFHSFIVLELCLESLLRKLFLNLYFFMTVLLYCFGIKSPKLPPISFVFGGACLFKTDLKISV